MELFSHRAQPGDLGFFCKSSYYSARKKNTSTQLASIFQCALLYLLTLLFCSPTHSETLIIPGSGNPEYILGVLAGAFNKQQSSHTVLIPPTIGSAGAFREISEGHASIGRLGRQLNEAERQQGFTFYSLGRDPVVFVGGAGVTVRNISPAQIFGIYSGQITNWQELGGKSASIRAIGREITDASYRGIARGMAGFSGVKYADSVKLAHLDTQLLELLDRFSASFGFLNRSALFAAKTKLTHFSLATTQANAENLKSGQYPLWVEIGLTYKKKELTEAGRAFLDYISSPDGQRVLESHGLVVSPQQ